MIGETVEEAFVYHGYTSETPAQVAESHDLQSEIMKLLEAKRASLDGTNEHNLLR
jgi:hypothetical protein